MLIATHFHKRIILILKVILRVDAVVTGKKKKKIHLHLRHKSKLMHKTCLIGCFHKLFSINFSKMRPYLIIGIPLKRTSQISKNEFWNWILLTLLAKKIKTKPHMKETDGIRS